jgi:hypothetical protein
VFDASIKKTEVRGLRKSWQQVDAHNLLNSHNSKEIALLHN